MAFKKLCLASFGLSMCCAFICLKLLFQKAIYIFLEPGKNVIKGLSVGVIITSEWFLSTHRIELATVYWKVSLSMAGELE